MRRSGFIMLGCSMAGVEAVVAETAHHFPRHTHDQFGIGVIHRGAQKSASGRGPVEAGPGSLITVNPGEVHDGVPIGDAGRAWRMLYFEPPLIAEALDDISQGRQGAGEFTQPVLDNQPIADCFDALFRAVTANGDVVSREQRLLILLAHLVDGAEGKKREAPAPLKRALVLIEDDPAAPLTLSDLAREAGVSRFQLLRGFARVKGLTPHAYLMQRRIQLARRLIAGGVPLAEAAVTAGFADQSHMTRLFVRTTGIAPGAYVRAVT